MPAPRRPRSACGTRKFRRPISRSAPRYYQVLNDLIDSPEALAHDPLLVKRLRRQRATRQKERSAKRLGFSIKV